MKTRVHELMRIGDALYAKRFPLLTLWQSFAENFYPIRADMTRARYISEEFASYLMTGRPVLAHRELANAISAILRRAACSGSPSRPETTPSTPTAPPKSGSSTPVS